MAKSARTTMHVIPRLLLIGLLSGVLAVVLAAMPDATAAQGTQPEHRIALVVTNQDHEPELIPLANTHADGEIVAAALQRTGFDVQILRDGSRKAFLRALADFERKIQAAGPNAVAFFYFSGHCWANQTSNYLILDEQLPQDVRELSIGARQRALPMIGVPLQAVTALFARHKIKAGFVVIDSHLDVAEPALINEVSALQQAPDKHPGFILSAQGRPGMPAFDTNDFSNALAGAILTPGLSASDVFKQVRVKVAEVTKGRNQTWIEDRLLTNFVFTPLAPPPTSSTPTQRAEAQVRSLYNTAAVLAGDLPARVEDSLWQAVVNTGDVRLYDAYLATYPQGRYRDLARQKSTALAVNAAARPPAPTQSSLGKPASRRVALVIGNAAYVNETTLKNPVNDARAIARALRDVGFADVQEAVNLDRRAMLDAIRAFGDAAATADWAVIYYSGHGLEVGGTNYLIPVDAKLSSQAAVADEAVALDRLLAATENVRAVRMLIVDACRSNNFPSRWTTAGAAKGGRSKGLAAVPVETGSIIAFATGPGQEAKDGEGPMNPYASALIQHMGSGRDIRLMLGDVRDAVLAQKSLGQDPWYNAALGGRELSLKP